MDKNGLKALTVCKSRAAKTHNTDRNNDGLNRLAIAERAVAYGSKSLGKDELANLITACECLVTDNGNGRGNVNTLEIGTEVEGICANLLKSLGKSYADNIIVTLEYLTNLNYGISLYGLRNNNLSKSLVTSNGNCLATTDEVGNTPKKGEVLSWAESSAVVYANSVLGARCNRNSGIIDIMGSIVGFVPYFGLLTDAKNKQEFIEQ